MTDDLCHSAKIQSSYADYSSERPVFTFYTQPLIVGASR